MTGLVSTVRRKIRRLGEFASFRGVMFFAQRRVLGPEARERVAHFVARFLPGPISASDTPSKAAAALADEGVAMLDDVLSPQMVEEMRDHLSRQRVYAPYLENQPELLIDAPELPDTHVLTVLDEGLMSCPHLLEIANHPKVIAAVEGVFGCKPTIGYMQAWWSVPTPDGKPRFAELFHRDFDDVAFLKLFIYLTDVEPENGPHEFVLASHKDASLRPIRRYSDNEVITNFGANRLVRFTGKAGTMFIENTTGLHRGLPVSKGRRLILQIVYSMLPMAYGPAKPYRRELFQPAAMAIDPYVNRIYVSQP
jgi:hypothetical protein